MDLNVDQPIAALASPAGGAFRGIVRISGRWVEAVLADWFTPDDPEGWIRARSARSHQARLRLADTQSSTTIAVQVLFWPGTRSYTGQPLIELHLPGSPCLLEAVLGECFRHGARPARPGEFTLRAFLANKLDLLQAEAVLGVIDASNHAELQSALAQLAGGVSGQLGHLRRDLLELLADLEAGLDFVDEDIEFVSRDEVVDRLHVARTFVDELLQQTGSRMQSHVRAKVVLAGLPNAGKSTLFNRLVGENSALVSPEQGTTRDFLTRSVTCGDVSFDLVDTAGWEQGTTGIAAAAQSQRSEQLEHADILLWCSSATLNDAEREIDDTLFQVVRTQANHAIRVVTKRDLAEPNGLSSSATDPTDVSTTDSIPLVSVSAVTDLGLPDLQIRLRNRLSSETGKRGQWLGMTASRCRETLESIASALGRAVESAKVPQVGDELIAVDLRDALDNLGAILGVIYTDDILDRVFSKFCIGK